MKQWQKLFYASGSLGTALSYQAFTTHVQFLYIDVFGLSAALIGTGWAVYGIWNAINDPLAGSWSDRTRTRWGRRTPWIAATAAPVGLFFLLLWVPPESLVGVGGDPLFAYFIVVVLIFDLLWTIVVMNWTALTPEMFVEDKERASVSGWREVFSIGGLIAGVALMPILAGEGWANRGPVATLFALITSASFLLSLLGTRERKDIQSQPRVSFMQSLKAALSSAPFRWFLAANLSKEFVFSILAASMPFYAKYVLGASTGETGYVLGAAFVAAILGLVLWTRYAKRAGARRAWQVCCITFSLSTLPFLFASDLASGLITATILGLSLAGYLMLPTILISDVTDADELETHTRREGMFFGINGFVIRFAFTLQGLALGVVLATTGYVQPLMPADTPAQPDAALWGMRALVTLLPIAASAITYWALARYPLHGERLTEVRRQLAGVNERRRMD